MRYAININLDYDAHRYEIVNALFRQIRDGMVQSGFRRDGRLFTIELPSDEARALARHVVEVAGAEAGFTDLSSFIKEFYGFDFDNAVNLLLPSSGEIGVKELVEEVEFIEIDPRK